MDGRAPARDTHGHGVTLTRTQVTLGGGRVTRRGRHVGRWLGLQPLEDHERHVGGRVVAGVQTRGPDATWLLAAARISPWKCSTASAWPARSSLSSLISTRRSKVRSKASQTVASPSAPEGTPQFEAARQDRPRAYQIASAPSTSPPPLAPPPPRLARGPCRAPGSHAWPGPARCRHGPRRAPSHLSAPGHRAEHPAIVASIRPPALTRGPGPSTPPPRQARDLRPRYTTSVPGAPSCRAKHTTSPRRTLGPRARHATRPPRPARPPLCDRSSAKPMPGEA